MLKVSVIYALPEQQFQVQLDIEIGATAQHAIEQSGILNQFPEIDLLNQAIGIYGRKVPLDYQLQPNDRIEIYRPLQIDPRDARIKKVKAERNTKAHAQGT